MMNVRIVNTDFLYANGETTSPTDVIVRFDGGDGMDKINGNIRISLAEYELATNLSELSLIIKEKITAKFV